MEISCIFSGHLRFEWGSKNKNAIKLKFKMATILRDETERGREREIRVSRLSTTSVVCGPTKDNGPVNLSGRDERMSVRRWSR